MDESDRGSPPSAPLAVDSPSISTESAPGKGRGATEDASTAAGPNRPAVLRDVAPLFTANRVDQSCSAHERKMGRKMFFSCTASNRRAAILVGTEWSRARASDFSVMTLLSHPREPILSAGNVARTALVSTRAAQTVNRIALAVPSWFAAVPRGGTEPASERSGDSQHGHHRERKASIRCRRLSFFSSVPCGMMPSLRRASINATMHHFDAIFKTAAPPECALDLSQKRLTSSSAAALGLTTAGIFLLKILP